MIVIKGFAPNTTLAVNIKGIVNPLGELSTQSITYTKEKGFYFDRDVDQNISFVSFTSESNGQHYEIEADFQKLILEVTKEVYQVGIDNYKFQTEAQDFLDRLYTKFNGRISDITLGAIVDDGNLWLPERFGFKIVDTRENQIDVWLADESFQLQFPDSEIVVTLPFDNIDDFFKKGTEVEALLNAITQPIMGKRVQEARGKDPESFLEFYLFDYYDPKSDTRIVPSPWAVLIYGIAGNNIDAIKKAIQDAILSQSTHTREEWAEILPDIFKRNEFSIDPMWAEIAIPNKTTESGRYSPIVKTNDIVAYLKAQNPDYAPAHINAHASATGFPYNSLMVAIIGHQENRDAKYSIRDVFPDWINTNTTQDFNRMTARTKEFALLLTEAVHQAETFTEFSTIPENYLKVVRDGKLFLTFSYEGINYLVLCKINVLP